MTSQGCWGLILTRSPKDEYIKMITWKTCKTLFLFDLSLYYTILYYIWQCYNFRDFNVQEVTKLSAKLIISIKWHGNTGTIFVFFFKKLIKKLLVNKKWQLWEILYALKKLHLQSFFPRYIAFIVTVVSNLTM